MANIPQASPTENEIPKPPAYRGGFPEVLEPVALKAEFSVCLFLGTGCKFLSQPPRVYKVAPILREEELRTIVVLRGNAPPSDPCSGLRPADQSTASSLEHASSRAGRLPQTL